MLCINYHMISLAVSTSGPILYLGYVSKQAATAPDSPQKLAELRKQHSLTEQQLADRIGMHVIQLRRYEGGASQPTLDVIRKRSTALQVSADMLLFGKDQRGPDDDLRPPFEAISRFEAEERQVIRSLLDGMILKHETRRWFSPAAAAPGSSERK